MLVGCEMIIANLALHALLAIYHLICNAHTWNNCLLHVLLQYFVVMVAITKHSFDFILQYMYSWFLRACILQPMAMGNEF